MSHEWPNDSLPVGDMNILVDGDLLNKPLFDIDLFQCLKCLVFALKSLFPINKSELKLYYTIKIKHSFGGWNSVSLFEE